MKTCAALLIVASLTSIADAEERIVTLDRTCVAIDTETDGLSETDRSYALALMQRVLERENLLVVASDCTENYAFSHQLVDGSYVIRVRSSAGKRRMKTTSMSELSDKYERMVEALIEAKAAEAKAAEAKAAAPKMPAVQQAAATPASDALPTVAVNDLDSTTTVDTVEQAPPSQERLRYALLGLQVTGGAAFTLGYRRELSNSMIDISGNVRSSETSTSGASLGVELLGYVQKKATSALYAGGGLSVGTMETSGYDYYGRDGSGLQGELTAGVQFGGTSGRRGIIQADLTLPFYRLGNEGMKEYHAAFMISGGVGF